MAEGTCSTPGCDSPHGRLRRGWCDRCYYRWYRAGIDDERRAGVERRFWAKVKKTPTCWLWQRALDEWGYGRFGGGSAHRVAWRFAYGPVPKGLQVLHRCDNPPCVRPDHLFLGSQADNMADMVVKGRALRGERNPNAKLTWEAVRAIRAQHAAGVSKHSLSRQFGVDRTVITSIVDGLTWKEPS